MTHYHHKNIIKLCDRPYENVNEMNEDLIARWNAKVGKDDHVFHLGDVSYSGLEPTYQILKRLNGYKYLLIGNHEDGVIKHAYVSSMFQWTKYYYELKVFDSKSNFSRKIVLFHYPIAEWNGYHRGVWHLFGHCHNNRADIETDCAFDIGVDCTNFEPLSFYEVRERMLIKEQNKIAAKKLAKAAKTRT